MQLLLWCCYTYFFSFGRKWPGDQLGKRSKTPITVLCRDGGTPPPPSPHHGKRPAKKLTEKNHGKGGYSPPPHHGKRLGIFFAKNGVFCLKNTVFGPIFNRFFNHGKGGYPPPSRHATGQKVNGKKITAKGGTPPHHGTKPWLGFLNPPLRQDFMKSFIEHWLNDRNFSKRRVGKDCLTFL